ncbi:hypothetical protein PybrP1_002090 [[Pythium] brassicae (nom. inval.)]|nr:hypothetical protein PybrP1_002090 [[Pythium] brassicae (nom. inval.)]
MLALKAFVLESVQELDDAKLQLLSETLRIDLRGCNDRRDVERVVTGLVCLDQDTSLGVFLSWLRTASESSGQASKKDAFYNTFVPAIAPLDQQLLQQRHHKPRNREEAAPEEQVKAHHLDEEIEARLAELQLHETEFKAAERAVHSGTPAFDKMKQFLVKLTVLRAKEEETRRFFVKQNALLKQQHREMREEALHTRGQLDFFVDGFTNLRLRHDALLAKSTQMHAESEAAQELFLSLSADESHFAAVMAHTLSDQRAQNLALQVRVDAATETIRALEAKQTQLTDTISQLKQARGDAKKDAHCYKRQLRNCKRKLTALGQASTDCVYFRSQAVNLRQAFAGLLGYLRESILRDTKSPKPTLSKEALRIIHQALSGPKSKQNADLKGDLDEAVRGVLLLGGAEGESAQCASILGAKFKYAPIDVREALVSFEAAALSYQSELQRHIRDEMQRRHARGFVLFNWEFTVRDANLLIALGFPVDSIADLQNDRASSVARQSGAHAVAVAVADKAERSASANRKREESDASAKLADFPIARESGAYSARKAVAEKKVATKVDRKAAFKGMLHLYRQVAPATFPEERVQRILEALEQQRAQRAAVPPVQWDEASARTSELLAMFAEDIHTVLFTEQESRKPKKPGESSAAPPSRLGGVCCRDEPANQVYHRVVIVVVDCPWSPRTWGLFDGRSKCVRIDTGIDLATPKEAQQTKKRCDTPTPAAHLPLPSLGPLGDKLEERAAGRSLSVLVGVPIEDAADELGVGGETDALQRGSRISSSSNGSGSAAGRGSWTPASPTIVPLPSRQTRVDEKPHNATDRLSAPTDDEPIDAEVFSALPPELQEEVLADRAARAASFEPRSSDSDDASSSSQLEDSYWVCHVCTFANHPQLAECEMCETLYAPPDELEWRDALPTPSGHRGRASSAGNELYAKLSQRLGASAVSRSLKKIRLPATPAATKLTMKEEPTAEDLLVVATAKIQQLQSSASQTLTHAKRTLIARTHSSGRKHSGAGAARLPSSVAASELGVLQRDLNRKCEAGDELFETLLQRLWDAIYHDAPARRVRTGSSDYAGGPAAAAAAEAPPFSRREFARVSAGWVDVGFQSANPDTDFRGGGVLALKCLVYAFEAFPQQMLAVAAAQKPAEGKRWYPVCVAGINLTCMLAGLLKLGNGEFSGTPAAHWPLFEDPSAFYQLFYYTLVKMDATWRRMNASYMEFGVVLKATRRIAVHMLAQAPETLAELRDVADHTFLDRFVVCHTNRTLADSENGECPDPFNVLEDENDALLRPCRAALSARLTSVSPTH